MNINPGLCPHCKGTDGYLTVGKLKYFVCDLHKISWLGLETTYLPRGENETIWLQHIDQLEHYTETKPVYDRMAVYPDWEYGTL